MNFKNLTKLSAIALLSFSLVGCASNTDEKTVVCSYNDKTLNDLEVTYTIKGNEKTDEIIDGNLVAKIEENSLADTTDEFKKGIIAEFEKQSETMLKETEVKGLDLKLDIEGNAIVFDVDFDFANFDPGNAGDLLGVEFPEKFNESFKDNIAELEDFGFTCETK